MAKKLALKNTKGLVRLFEKMIIILEGAFLKGCTFWCIF